MKTKGPVVNTTGIKSDANIIPSTWLFYNIQIHTYKEHRKKRCKKTLNRNCFVYFSSKLTQVMTQIFILFVYMFISHFPWQEVKTVLCCFELKIFWPTWIMVCVKWSIMCLSSPWYEELPVLILLLLEVSLVPWDTTNTCICQVFQTKVFPLTATSVSLSKMTVPASVWMIHLNVLDKLTTWFIQTR